MADPQTLVHWIAKWAKEKPDTPALWSRSASGAWSSQSWKQYYDRVRAVAKGLIALGHKPGEPVSLVGANRPEWVISQFGISAAGGIPAPIYPTSTKEQTGYINKHSGTKIAIVENQELLTKHLECIDEGLMDVEKVVTMDDLGSKDPRVMTFAELEKAGDDDAEVDKRLGSLTPDDTAFFIFTSGTTGLPKGAQITNEGVATMSHALRNDYPEINEYEFVAVSYLPLSHIAEQLFTNLLSLSLGGEVYFCGNLKEIKDYLVQARPTLFLGVPRVWEKFEAAMRAKIGEKTGIPGKIAAWAMKTELAAFKESVRLGRQLDTFSRKLANKLVISKVKGGLGFDRLILAGSGAAPISTETLEFFASLGIVVHEAYGMTETTGVATVQPLHYPRFGTVGKPLTCVELKIAEDGEVLLKGKNMIKSYYKLPDKTEELYEGSEWLHTGDLGEVDKDGFLKITGRKKDLIITAGGKNVAPAEIEQYLVTIPGVGQTVVVGDRQPYLTALFALDPESFQALLSAAGSATKTIEEAAKCDKVRAYVQKHIDTQCNPKLAQYQTVKKFEVLPAPFSVDSGELTPTMKVKRNVVNDKYASVITGMYSGGTLNTPEPAKAEAAS